MALSALDDLSTEPTDDQVAAVLEQSFTIWSSLRSWLTGHAAIDQWQWGSSGKKYGWDLRCKAGKRTVAYMIPQHGSFLVGLVLGDRAVQAARAMPLSGSAAKIITNAKKYAEGTGFRLPVTEMEDLEDVKLLVQAKLG